MARLNRGGLSRLLVCLLQLGMTNARFLFGADQSGQLWRGETSADDNDVLRNVHQMARPIHARKLYGTLSYDSFDDNFLLHVSDNGGNFSRIQTIDPCPEQTDSNTLHILLENMIPISESDPYLTDCDEGIVCGWTAMSYFYSEIYFLFVGRFGNRVNDTTIRVDLRAFDGCEDQLYANSDFAVLNTTDNNTTESPVDFSILNCSRLVAIALELPYNANEQLRAGKHIAVQPVGNELHFFFQIVRIQPHLNDSSLCNVIESLHRATNFGLVHNLYEDIDTARRSVASLAGHGGVSVQGQLVCWAMLDRVYCASITDMIVEKQTLVLPGEVMKRDICVGNGTEDGAAIAGLSMVADGWLLTVYFGCYFPDGTGSGAGVARTDTFIERTHITPLWSSQRRLSAHSIVQMEQLPFHCNHA